jgi:hypothetical protein
MLELGCSRIDRLSLHIERVVEHTTLLLETLGHDLLRPLRYTGIAQQLALVACIPGAVPEGGPYNCPWLWARSLV